MSMIYGVMPPLMVWRLRYGQPGGSSAGTANSNSGASSSGGRRPLTSDINVDGKELRGGAQVWVPVGRVALGLLCTSAAAVEVGQAAISAGWL